VPDPRTLQIGDYIRILRVPENDLIQRANEIESGSEMAGWTADSIERIIAQTPVVQISRIDEDGCVWYETTIIGPDAREETHSLIVYDDDTWEPVAEGGR
jgi:ethanolamine ammonia-lyase large subunit